MFLNCYAFLMAKSGNKILTWFWKPGFVLFSWQEYGDSVDIDGFDIDYGVRNYCVVFVVARSLKDIEFFFF